MLAIFCSGIFMTGYFSSPIYKGEIAKQLNSSAKNVWDLLDRIDDIHKNRKEIVSVEMVGKSNNSKKHWRELTDMGGFIEFKVIDYNPLKKIQLRMINSSFGMSGVWTYEIEEVEGSIILNISEDSNNTDILARSMLTIFGRASIIKRELKLIESLL